MDAARSYELPGSLFYGLYPISLGDFNGDGYPDVVVYDQSSSLQVFPGNPTGSLGAPIQTTVCTPIQWIAVGDFNGDGNLDLAAANASWGGISLFPGDGTGSLQSAIAVSSASAS